jgi:UDP-N-acetylmuramyl pentapeptide phosphotransferase/UDP-N-acetylglucosamine-1-phosphate transferase
LFPKVPDYHKPNKPLVPNGLGVIYVLVSVTYLFAVYYFNIPPESNNVSSALTLAVCILFGGFMGLIDDWMDLRWRYKAFFPLIAAIPLMALAYRLPHVRTAITIPIFGTMDFGIYYYFILIPLIVTIATNTVNQLGGLNGLETVCPAIVMIGLMVVSGQNAILLIIPLAVWLILAFFNFRGKIFVGNTGSFAIGITLTAFAIISDLKWYLLISILPYILNSSMILLNYFFFRAKANVSFDGKRLFSDNRRSLITLITYKRPLTERQVVAAISLLFVASTCAALLFHYFS